jgi:hypothetical protein
MVHWIGQDHHYLSLFVEVVAALALIALTLGVLQA